MILENKFSHCVNKKAVVTKVTLPLQVGISLGEILSVNFSADFISVT